MLWRAQMPAVPSQTPGEVDFVIQRRRRDGGRHRPQTVQRLQKGDGFETRRDRVGALQHGYRWLKREILVKE